MYRHVLSCCAILAGLGACHADVKDDNGAVASISIGNSDEGNGGPAGGQSVSVKVPGFSGKMTVPGLDIGSENAKIDDMPFFPGTKVTGINVTGEPGDGSGGRSKGQVDMAFTAPGGAGRLIAWYRDQAQHNGWTVVPPAGGHQFEATRDKAGETTRFALQATPQGGGSAGHLLVSGS